MPVRPMLPVVFLCSVARAAAEPGMSAGVDSPWAESAEQALRWASEQRSAGDKWYSESADRRGTKRCTGALEVVPTLVSAADVLRDGVPPDISARNSEQPPGSPPCTLVMLNGQNSGVYVYSPRLRSM